MSHIDVKVVPGLGPRSPAQRLTLALGELSSTATEDTAVDCLTPLLSVEELGLALAHCGMRPLHSALATTSSTEKA